MALGLATLAACADQPTTESNTTDPTGALPRHTVAVLKCTARVANPEVSCQDVGLEGVGSASRSGGPRRDLHVLGGQGIYVRLASASPAYNSGTEIFSFNTTVQDLATLAMATSDGATRHNNGVQVFFSALAATGGTGSVSVANATGQATFTATGQDYFQYGGQIGGIDQAELGADGILSTAEVSSAKLWQLKVPSTVTTFAFTLYVSTEMAPGPVVSAAPQVSSVSPNPMVPGAPATLTGTNFNPTPASNTVSIGGAAVTVTGATPTSLTVTVPCVSSGSVPVNVTTGGMKGGNTNAPLQVPQQAVGIGQAVVLTSAASSYCNELPSVNGAARYLVAVFSDSNSPSSNAPFQFAADAVAGAGEQQQPAGNRQVAEGITGATRHITLDQAMSQAQETLAERKHFELLEANRAAYARGRAQFPQGMSTRGMRLNRDVVYGDPPGTRQFRVSNISPPAGQTICSSFYVVNATRVYFNGKLAIYEDDATPAGLRSSDNASMAAYYQSIGDQFNADMEPILRNTFGDILRRDAETDNNGIEIALFTPRINNSFSGVAGFVVSCDQFPNNDTTTTPRAPGGPYTGLNSTGGTASFGASNLGEYFYAYQPTINGSGFGTVGTPDYWYRTIRSTFIHESKHVASMSARVANNAPSFEASWLEEGTARHAEEMWMRNAVDNQAWKSNIPFGSLANPINLYCDLRTTAAECLANPRRPSVNMLRHFNPMYTEMFGQNARLLSPFGPTSSDTQSFFYAVSWSLLRYAIDRYGASDAAFLGALTNATTSGTDNLTATAGASLDQLLGGWALALAADDHPLLAGPASPDIQFPTWNLRSIYAGLNTDPNASGFTLAYPLVPTQLSFGTFTPAAIVTLRGGGALWYEISGTQTRPQLLRLTSNTGGTLPATLRLAVTRIQ